MVRNKGHRSEGLDFGRSNVVEGAMLKDVSVPYALIVKMSAAIHRQKRSATFFAAGMCRLHDVHCNCKIFDATAHLRAPERV
jgi:hypothetical protein